MPDDLEFELGFAIEDPCDLDTMALARALVHFGKSVPPNLRRDVARQLEAMAVDLKAKANVESNLSGNRGGVRVLFGAGTAQEDDGRKHRRGN